MQSYGMVIDGRAVNTKDQDPVINPAFGEPFATCARASTDHVNEAVAAAKKAFATWRKDESLRRAKLGECAAILQAKAAEIAPILSQEQGKPLNHAMMEIFGASMWFGYYAGLQVEPEVLQDDGDKRVEVVRKPIGVVAAITPWNFPVILLSWKLAPAFLAGNTVVAKPSPFTPLSSLMVAEALREVLPAGVLNVLSGGNELGAELTRHPDVRKISFTGSVATGKKVMSCAAEDLKRVTLELGGNDPAIVLDDVDPDQVAEGLFWGAFQNSGQVCSAIKRIYVPEKLHDKLVANLADRAKRTKVGPGMEPDVELGPINNRMQFEKVLAMVEDAKSKGGKIVAGGARLGDKGYFLPPTIVTDVGRGVKLVDDEQFGTALPIVKYKDLDDAIAQANGTHYGLGASVWTKSVARGTEIARELDAGTTWVNNHLDLSPMQPFGGHKWSGIGVENGSWGYKEFTQLQVVSTKKS